MATRTQKALQLRKALQFFLATLDVEDSGDLEKIGGYHEIRGDRF